MCKAQPWGQLAVKFLDLVTSKSISVEQLVVRTEKNGTIGDTSICNVKL